MRSLSVCLVAGLAYLQLLTISTLAGCASPEPQVAANDLTLAEALAQIDQLPAPAGLPPAEFDTLRQALGEQLTAIGAGRWTSAAPGDAQNRVSDLYLEKIDEVSAQASWSYLNVGDYDQNSEVNIADLAPIGVNYMKNSASPGWSAAVVVDGDNNGEVNIADVTPLGLHIQNSVEGYELQSSATPEVEESWLPVAGVAFADSTQAAPGARRVFTTTVPAVSGMSFRAVPYFAAVNGIPGTPFAYTGQTGGGQLLSYEERKITLDLIAEKFNNLTATTSDGQDAELADYIATLPHIEAAGFFEGNAWGRFDDEQLAIVCKNHAPASGQQASSLREMLNARLHTGTSRTASSGLPENSMGNLLNGYGDGFPLYANATFELRDILEEAGYSIYRGEVGLTDLMMSDDGLLYIESPAGAGRGRNDQFQYWIGTTHGYDSGNEARFLGDLANRRLAYMFALDNSGSGSWRYCFGAKFVKNYMSFCQNSIVFLNTPFSGAGTDMIEQLHLADASVVLAWMDNVDDGTSYIAATHLVDRLLGANEITIVPNPPIRAFNLMDTLFDMWNRGVSDAGQPIQYPLLPANPYANLMAFYNMSDPLNAFSLFVPTIEHLNVLVSEDGTGNVLEIWGDFGDTVGVLPVIHIGGEEVPVLEMPFPGLLTCELPDSGPSSFGNVEVGINDIFSLPRRLTSWRGSLTRTETGPGSLTRTITYNFHFRGDINSYRTEPDTNPLINAGEGTVDYFGAPDGYAIVSASGSYTDPVGTVTTYSDAADTHMDQAYGVNYGNGDFTCAGSINLKTGKMVFTMAALAPFHEKRVNSLGVVEFDDDTFFYNDLSFGPSPAFEVFQLNLSDYSIEPGQFEKQVADIHFSASWEMFPASFPPYAPAPR